MVSFCDPQKTENPASIEQHKAGWVKP